MNVYSLCVLALCLFAVARCQYYSGGMGLGVGGGYFGGPSYDSFGGPSSWNNGPFTYSYEPSGAYLSGDGGSFNSFPQSSVGNFPSFGGGDNYYAGGFSGFGGGVSDFGSNPVYGGFDSGSYFGGQGGIY